MNPFAELIKVIGVEYDRRQYDRNMARLGQRLREGGKRHHKAMAGLAGELETMAKSMNEAVAQVRVMDKASAFDRLAAISAKGNELAAAGKLTGEEGAYLDIVIAHTADRIRAL